ncbi:hypothetical protein FHX14_006329 [Rhizobium sp. BK619]|nr:hypothetical protein [Rhizobium sp. BK619]
MLSPSVEKLMPYRSSSQLTESLIRSKVLLQLGAAADDRMENLAMESVPS